MNFKIITAILVIVLIWVLLAQAEERIVHGSFSDVWKKTLQSVILEGVTITTQDKETGIIQGTGKFSKDSPTFVCKRVKGNADSYDYVVNAVVQEIDDSSSRVSITSKGNVKSYEYRRFIFFKTSRVFYDQPCESTSILEKALLDKVTK